MDHNCICDLHILIIMLLYEVQYLILRLDRLRLNINFTLISGPFGILNIKIIKYFIL